MENVIGNKCRQTPFFTGRQVVKKISLIFFVLLVQTLYVGQVRLQKNYVSTTEHSGILKLRNNHSFKLTDSKTSTLYHGRWATKNDTLILCYKSSERIHNNFFPINITRLFRKKQEDNKIDTLFIDGTIIRDNHDSHKSLFVSKKDYYSNKDITAIR